MLIRYSIHRDSGDVRYLWLVSAVHICFYFYVKEEELSVYLFKVAHRRPGCRLRRTNAKDDPKRHTWYKYTEEMQVMGRDSNQGRGRQSHRGRENKTRQEVKFIQNKTTHMT